MRLSVARLAAIASVMMLVGSWSIAARAAQPRTPVLPLRVSASSPVSFGNWRVDSSGDYVEAFTANESGSSFGILCGKTCVYHLNMQTSCNEDEKYPAMMNSAAGAASIELRCVNADAKSYLVFNSDLAEAIKKGGEIGFAIPLVSGRFNVSRFSLIGAAQAMIAAIKMSQDAAKRSQSGLRDFSL